MTTPTDPPGEAEARRAESAREMVLRAVRSCDRAAELCGCKSEDRLRAVLEEEVAEHIAARIAALEAEVAALQVAHLDAVKQMQAAKDEVAETERLRAAAVAYQTELIHEVAWLRRNMAEEEARGFSAAREAAAAVAETRAYAWHETIAPTPYLAHESAALTILEDIRALRPAQAQQGDRDA